MILVNLVILVNPVNLVILVIPVNLAILVNLVILANLVILVHHHHHQGSPTLPKRMNFRKNEFSEKKGGGSFPIQKFILQNLDSEQGFFWHKNDTKGYFQGMFFQ